MSTNNFISKLVNEQPKFNPQICDGFAYSQLQDVTKHIDIVMEAVSRSFLEGFTYLGCKICTPMEQFIAQANLPARADIYDVSRSSVFMVKYMFSYKGVKLTPKYIMLPYAERGGIFTIRGTKNVVSPVMADNVFTIENNNIFIPLTRSRINVSSLHTSYIADNVEQNVNTAYSQLHNKEKNARKKRRFPTLGAYLFAYFGVTKTFKQYFGTTVHVHEKQMPDKYPKSKWVMCRSNGNMYTRNIKRRIPQNAHYILYVEKSKFDKPGVKELIGAFYYSLDHIIEDGFVTDEYIDTDILWKRILTRFVYSSEDSEQKLMEKVKEHLDTLEHYVDDLVVKKLSNEKDIGKDINFIGLMAYLISNYARLTETPDEADTSKKHLSTTPYVLYPIIKELFTLMYNSKNISNSNATMNARDSESVRVQSEIRKIEKALRKFPVDKILNISSINADVNTLSTATDNMLHSVTLPTLSQARATGKLTKDQENSAWNPAAVMHPSVIISSSYKCISKSTVTGRGKLNPYTPLNKNGEFVIEPEVQVVYDNLKELVKRD